MPGETAFSERLLPLQDVPASRQARCRMVTRLWWTPALLALAVLVLAACQSTPTPTPTLVLTPTPTPTLVPTPTPTPTLVPTPTPIPTLTPTPVPPPLPPSTLAPTPASSPSFSGLLGQIAEIDYGLAQQIADYRWIADGVSDEEANALDWLRGIARKDSEVARLVAVRPWFIEGGGSHGWGRLAVLHEISLQDFRVVEQLMGDPWLIDEGPEDQWQTLGFLLGILSLDVDVPTVVIGGPLPREPTRPVLGRGYRQGPGLNILRDMAALDLGLVGTIVNRPWFKEGEHAAQWGHIWALHDISRRDLELAKTLVRYQWLIDGDAQLHGEVFGHIHAFVVGIDLELANQLVGASWFVDGVTEDENQSLFHLEHVALLDVQLAKRLLNYPWATDDLTASELRTFEFLSVLTKSDPTMLQPVVDAPWFVDGVSDPEYVRLVLGLPQDAGDIISDISDTLRDYVLDSLSLVARVSFDSLRALGTQPWLLDGLDSEEAAFITAISRIPVDSPTLYQDLLDTHFTQAKTVSLPLAGDVNIWVFSNEPFKLREDHRPLIEDTARILEDFLKVPFPTTDIILLAVSPTPRQFYVGSFHAGSHMQLLISHFMGAIPHETAHYYFNSRAGRRWFREGGANFISNLVYYRIGLREFPSSKTSKAQARQICGFENIRHLQFVKDSSWEWDVNERYGCFYSMGENFMHAVLETIGEEAMSSALREHFLALDNNRHDLEQAIYRAFLKHAPSDRKEDFQEIYRTLHGGPYAYPDPPATDDHGDGQEDATPVILGDVVQGTLDYMFDFDYFQFSAEQGRKYQINVTHETLGTTSIGLYASGSHRISQDQALESRKLGEDGPQVVWVAPSSDDYYFAVHNFGDEIGVYTFTITLADN